MPALSSPVPRHCGSSVQLVRPKPIRDSSDPRHAEILARLDQRKEAEAKEYDQMYMSDLFKSSQEDVASFLTLLRMSQRSE